MTKRQGTSSAFWLMLLKLFSKLILKCYKLVFFIEKNLCLPFFQLAALAHSMKLISKIENRVAHFYIVCVIALY